MILHQFTNIWSVVWFLPFCSKDHLKQETPLRRQMDMKKECKMCIQGVHKLYFCYLFLSQCVYS